MKKIFFLVIILSIIIPGIFELYNGYFFGDDPYEYVLSAKVIFQGFHSVYSYPYPIMGIIYFPTIFMGNTDIIYFSTILSMLFFLIMFFSFYLILGAFDLDYISKIFGSLTFSFSIPFLSEIGWGGQAQFFSLSLSFIAVYFFIKNKNYSYIFIFISLLTEPYSAVFSIIVIFSFIIYKKLFTKLIPFFISIISSGAILFILKSSSGIVLQPLILHLSFSIFGIYYLYFLILFILIILVIILINIRTLFYKTDFGKRYLPIIIIFIIPVLAYLFITPYNVPDRISYFIMIPIGLITGVFILYNKKNLKKFVVIILALALILLSYYSYPGDLDFYKNPIYLEQVGSYINSNSLKDESFLNVNINSGWALESFSAREMFYAASDTYYMIYKDQINNVLLGKIMSNSQYFINSSSTYLFLQNSSVPISVYTYNDYNFQRLFELDLNNSFIGNISMGGLPIELKNNSLKINNLKMEFLNGSNIMINLNSSSLAELSFNLYNCNGIRLNSSSLELISNNIKLKINLENIENLNINSSNIILKFKNNAIIKISDGKEFFYHSTDELFEQFNVKFAVMYDGYYAQRFHNDRNFALATKIKNVLIFEFIG
ncbi:MAG: hypothetical protein RXO36_07300 [Candidatus Nanopusillus acidilobi]